MKTRFAVLALGVLAAVVSIPAAPSDAAAQCKCMDDACGCNSNGDGRLRRQRDRVRGLRLRTGERREQRRGWTAELEFTPDGAVVQVVRAEPVADPRTPAFASHGPGAAGRGEPRGGQALGGRWE